MHVTELVVWVRIERVLEVRLEEKVAVAAETKDEKNKTNKKIFAHISLSFIMLLKYVATSAKPCLLIMICSSNVW